MIDDDEASTCLESARNKDWNLRTRNVDSEGCILALIYSSHYLRGALVITLVALQAILNVAFLTDMLSFSA
jgi:hypothetical protein